MARRSWNRVARGALLLGSWCLLVAIAGAAPGVDLNAEQRALVWKLTADKALAVANERRLAIEEQAALNRRLDEQDRKLRAAEQRARGNRAELARIREERDQIAR